MAKKDDLPYMPFYIGDWRKATDVQALPLESKAIWFEMLLYMWESTERGYLTVNGKPIPENALARMLGLPELLLKQNVKYLLDFGVASIRESDGAIFCRRMVRDQEIREKRQKAGSLGGKKSFASRFAQAKVQANADIENEIDIENEDEVKDSNISHPPFNLGSNPGPLNQELADKAFQIGGKINKWRVAHGLKQMKALLYGTEKKVVMVLRTETDFDIDKITEAANLQPILWTKGLFNLDWLTKRNDNGDYNYKLILNYQWQAKEEKERGERLR